MAETADVPLETTRSDAFRASIQAHGPFRLHDLHDGVRRSLVIPRASPLVVRDPRLHRLHRRHGAHRLADARAQAADHVVHLAQLAGLGVPEDLREVRVGAPPGGQRQKALSDSREGPAHLLEAGTDDAHARTPVEPSKRRGESEEKLGFALRIARPQCVFYRVSRKPLRQIVRSSCWESLEGCFVAQIPCSEPLGHGNFHSHCC